MAGAERGSGGTSRPSVAISGSSGLIGRRLAAELEASGARVVRLVRRDPAPGLDEATFDPRAGRVDGAALEGLEAVVHLAGESVAGGRWTEARKRRIRDSRVVGTRLLAESLAGLGRPPRALIVASAIGFYGDRGDESLDESARPGTGFLPETCVAWEAASAAAEAAGIRVARPRIGVVLSAEGGALAKMLPVFRLGLGGRTGDGRQWMSWISLDDLVGALRFALERDDLVGAFNAVAPSPVRNAEFAAALGRALSRPARAPFPGWAVGAAFGEMGRELLLGSARVLPRRLEQAGFRFRHATLEDALGAALGRGGAS